MKLQKVAKKEYIKPQIKVEELSLRTLLGENGWMNPMAGKVLAYTAI